MKFEFSRRRMLGVLTGTLAGLVSAPAARAGKATVQKLFTSANAAKGYDPSKHKWLMSIDVDRCIGCGRPLRRQAGRCRWCGRPL